MSRIDAATVRDVGHDVHELIPARWSPRAMSGAAIAAADLERLFEAARWAPSSYNNQPWVFLYALRDGPDWQRYFDLLVEGNQVWAKHAGALIVVASRRKTEDGKDIPTHTFDTGAAWQNLALQGTAMGLVVHGMAGFDYAAARERLGIPGDVAVEAMIAVGHPGDPGRLPESLRGIETPSGRRRIAEFAFAGRFPTP
ncbi:MAG: nitroreductase family protein [Pseudomonadota bacterium]